MGPVYKVIGALSIYDLIVDMGVHVGMGFEPVGGITFVNDGSGHRFYQAVWRRADVRNPVRKPKKRPHKNKPQQTRKGTR